MSISSFGGRGSANQGQSSGTSPLVIGQAVQGAGGDGLLQADGRILNKADYPLAYAAIPKENVEVSTLQANTDYLSQVVSNNQPVPGAAISSKKTIVLLAFNSANVSTDSGATWQNVVLPTDPSGAITWRYVAANDTTFCAIGDKFSATSTDGLTWTLSPALQAFPYLGVFTWTGTQFAYFGAGQPSASSNTGAGNIYLTSADGLHWTLADYVPLANVGRIFTLKNGTYLATQQTGSTSSAANKVATSPDGVTWTVQNLPSSEVFIGAAYNSSNNTVCMITTTKILTSTDGGVTWTSTLMSGIAGNPFTGVATLNSMVATDSNFVMSAAASGGTFPAAIYKSVDGLNWTVVANFTNITNNQNIMAATDNAGTIVTAASTFVLVSKDEGATWKPVSPAQIATPVWSSVIWTGSQFVVFGNGAAGASYKSTDGLTWTLASASVPALPGPATLYSYNSTLATHFLMAGGVATTVCLTSPDGITWTSRALSASQTAYSLASSGGKTIVSNNTGLNVQLTTNGTTFAAQAATGAGGYYSAGSPTQFLRVPYPTAVVSTALTAYTSPDAITWTARTIPAPPIASWVPAAVFWTGTQFAVLDVSNHLMATSPDGITWTFTQFTWPVSPVASGTADFGVHVVPYGVNGVLFLAKTGSDVALSFSKDGLVTWNQPARVLPRAGTVNFLFAGKSAAGGGSEVIGSDGPFVVRFSDATGLIDVGVINYNVGNARQSVSLRAGGAYYTFGRSQLGTVAKSTDFVNWTPVSTLDVFPTEAAYVNGNVCFFASNGTTILNSSDGGVTWSKKTGVAGGIVAKLFAGISSDQSKAWVSLSGAGAVNNVYSHVCTFDGNNIAYKLPFYSSTVNGGVNQLTPTVARKNLFNVFGHVGDGVTSISTDGGATWATQSLSSAANPYAITYSSVLDMFVMVPWGNYASATAHAVMYTSKDGYKWTQRPMPSSQKWNSVIAFGSLFIAVASGPGTVWAYSNNGINWTQMTAASSQDWSFLTVCDRSLIVGNAASSAVNGIIGRLYDPATQFQLPAYTVTAGQPNWFIRVK